jgi:hypothetical protein
VVLVTRGGRQYKQGLLYNRLRTTGLALWPCADLHTRWFIRVHLQQRSRTDGVLQQYQQDSANAQHSTARHSKRSKGPRPAHTRVASLQVRLFQAMDGLKTVHGFQRHVQQ